MPVLHSSPEWQKLNETVTRTATKVESLEDALRVLSEKQERLHKENIARMEKIEASAQELRDELTEIKEVMAGVKGAFEGFKTAANGLKWTVGIVGGILTILIGIMTLFGPWIRNHAGLPSARNAVSSSITEAQWQDARVQIL